MNAKTIEQMTDESAFKTAEDAEAAARITARGFATEMERLASVFRLDKIAMGEVEATGEETGETGEEDLQGEDLLALLQELGGL